MRKIRDFQSYSTVEVPHLVSKKRGVVGEMIVVKAFLPLPLGQTVIRKSQIGQDNESLTYTDVIC